MRWYRRLSGSRNFQELSAISRRKAELVMIISWLAFGNLAVYAGLQGISGNPTLVAASLALIPFGFAMLVTLRFNQLGRRLVARWLLLVTISLAVVTEVFIFHGTDVKTYYYFGCVAAAAPLILPWRHRIVTLLFCAANLVLYVWLDSVELHVSSELIALHDSWVIRALNAWARLGLIGSIVTLILYMEYLANRTERELDTLAVTDSLTGLHNRRGAEWLMKRELAAASRRGKTLWLALVDIDHFKQINDRFGHENGDCALRQVAQELRTQAREEDIVARWGGEEFLVVILSCCDAKGAGMAAERLRGAIADREIDLEDAPALAVTISIGVAGVPPGGDLASAIARADQAMYRAKSAGRNRVIVADEATDIPARSVTDAGSTTD
jgi:diguanylate cyclase (GGDEF)-like protein